MTHSLDLGCAGQSLLHQRPYSLEFPQALLIQCGRKRSAERRDFRTTASLASINMTQKSRSQNRRRRGTVSRYTRRENTKNLSPPLLDSRQQQQKRLPTSGLPDAGQRSPAQGNNETPQVLLPNQKESLVADSSKVQALPTGKVHSIRKRPRQTTAHRPCTRSQTAGAASSLSSDESGAGVAAVDDTYAKYYPNRCASGHLVSPVQVSDEDAFAATANMVTTVGQSKRGRRKRRSLDDAPVDDLPRAQLSAKLRISWVSSQMYTSSVLGSSGKFPWPDAVPTHLAEPDEGSTVSKSEHQQETVSSFRSLSPLNCSQEGGQTKCGVPSKRHSYPRPRARQVLPVSLIGQQDQSVSVNCACDQTCSNSYLCETFELATGRIHTDEKRVPLSHFERLGMPSSYSRICPSKQLTQELSAEKPFFFFSRDLPEPSAPRWDHRFSPYASGQKHFTDESEIRSPTSSVRWKKKVVSALGTCIPETVIREAAAAPPVFDLPKGADSSVLCDQYLQICSQLLSARTPRFTNSNVTVAMPAENDVTNSPMRSIDQVEVSKAFHSYAHASDATGRPTAAKSMAVLPSASGSQGQPSLTVNGRYTQGGSPLTEPHQIAFPVTASLSHAAGRKLKLCRLLLQKYRSRVLSRPDGDRWRHLFFLNEAKPKWRNTGGCASSKE